MTVVRFFCVLFLSLLLSFSASAQSLDSQLSRLISAGQYKSAQDLLNANNPSVEDKLFFIGRVLKSQRQHAKAIAVFREILIRDPGYINARRELAHTLLLARQFDVAEYHFEQLLRDDPSPRMQGAYRRFLAVIAQNKPSGVSGLFSFVPSSNVNRGSALTGYVDDYGPASISEDSQQKSGIGLQLGLSGFFRRPLSPQSRLTFNWSLLGVKYKDESFDSLTARLSATYQKNTAWGNWTLTPFYRHSWGGEDYNVPNPDADPESEDEPSMITLTRFEKSSRSLGLRFGLQRKLSDRDRLSFSISGESRDYFEDVHLNGPFYYSSLSLSRRLKPDLSISGGLSLERSLPHKGHLKYDGVKLSTSVNKIWKNGLRTGFGLNAGRRDFSDIYPLRSYPRADTYWGATVSLFNPKFEFKGIAPRLSCSYTRNRSNVEFFVYDVKECQISLTRNF